MSETLWYYTDSAGEQRGPAMTADVRDLIARGEIPPTARFWREGLADWVHLDQVAAELGVAAPAVAAATPPPAPSAAPAFDPAVAYSRTPAETPVDPYAAPRVGAGPSYDRSDVVYAGFLRRWGAIFIDQLILLIPMVVIFGGLGFMGALAAGSGGDGTDAAAGFLILLAYPAYYAIAGFYYASQESSVHQATLGKRAMGIKVTDDDGRRLSFGHALARWFAAALSYVTFYIGFLMAAFTERKRALHDMVASTLVVDKWAFTDHPERQKREVSGCLIALLVVGLMVPVVAILAAISISQYQDYVAKSQFSEAPAIADGLKSHVVEVYTDTGKCPVNGEDGFEAPESYGGKYVERIDLGGTAPACVITATFRSDSVANPLKYASATFTGTDVGGTFQWKCEAPGIADKFLPMGCRP